MAIDKKIDFEMRFADIVVSKFSLYDLKKEFNKNVFPLIEFHSNFSFMAMPEQEQVVCIVAIKLLMIETKEEFAEITIENTFNIKPFVDVIKSKKENVYDIPENVMQNLVAISISTARGVLSEKLKGTIAQKDIFPLIDPKLLTKIPNPPIN